MYWVSVDDPAVEMSSLNGTGRVILFNETKANYTGITLYRDSLYISDNTRRSVFSYCCNMYFNIYFVRYSILVFSDVNEAMEE